MLTSPVSLPAPIPVDLEFKSPPIITPIPGDRDSVIIPSTIARYAANSGILCLGEQYTLSTTLPSILTAATTIGCILWARCESRPLNPVTHTEARPRGVVEPTRKLSKGLRNQHHIHSQSGGIMFQPTLR